MTLEDLVTYIAEKKLHNVRHSGENEINALCPFHDETKGSFFLNKTTGQWYCHGTCATGGSIHKLVRKLGLPLALLTDIAYTPAPKKKKIDETELPSELLGMFDYCPTKLIEDGFTEKTLQEHRIGFDKRFSRITFPVFCVEHKLRLVSGRTVIDQDPKYLIYTAKCYDSMVSQPLTKYSPHKRHYFFREDKLRRHSDVVLCEGFKAALWLAQQGYNSIASIGVSISDSPILLSKLGNFCIDTLYIMYDSDPAGLVNSIESARTILGLTKKVRFPQYPKKYTGPETKLQPDDLDKVQLSKAFDESLPLLQHKKEVVRCLSTI